MADIRSGKSDANQRPDILHLVVLILSAYVLIALMADTLIELPLKPLDCWNIFNKKPTVDTVGPNSQLFKTACNLFSAISGASFDTQIF